MGLQKDKNYCCDLDRGAMGAGKCSEFVSDDWELLGLLFFGGASLLYMRRVYMYNIVRAFQNIFFYRICEADPFSTKGTCFFIKMKPENLYKKLCIQSLISYSKNLLFKT